MPDDKELLEKIKEAAEIFEDAARDLLDPKPSHHAQDEEWGIRT